MHGIALGIQSSNTTTKLHVNNCNSQLFDVAVEQTKSHVQHRGESACQGTGIGTFTPTWQWLGVWLVRNVACFASMRIVPVWAFSWNSASTVHLYIMLLFIFTPSYYSFPGFLPSFICFDVQMICSNPRHFQQDSMPDVKNLTCPASISSMNFRAAAPLRVNTAVPLPNGFLPIFQIVWNWVKRISSVFNFHHYCSCYLNWMLLHKSLKSNLHVCITCGLMPYLLYPEIQETMARLGKTAQRRMVWKGGKAYVMIFL